MRQEAVRSVQMFEMISWSGERIGSGLLSFSIMIGAAQRGTAAPKLQQGLESSRRLVSRAGRSRYCTRQREQTGECIVSRSCQLRRFARKCKTGLGMSFL